MDANCAVRVAGGVGARGMKSDCRKKAGGVSIMIFECMKIYLHDGR
jgi:hypothetical protein